MASHAGSLVRKAIASPGAFSCMESSVLMVSNTSIPAGGQGSATFCRDRHRDIRSARNAASRPERQSSRPVRRYRRSHPDS